MHRPGGRVTRLTVGSGRILSRRIGRHWPTLTFVVLVVVPVYALVAAVVIRSGLWHVHGSPFNDEQFKALLLFLGTALGTTATLIGLLITRSSAARSLLQQQLDTAVQALNLIRNDTGYAAKAVVSGALATLVHLGHPVIAMRTLQTAWQDDAVDVKTAVWLIDQVLASTASSASASDLVASKQEAVEMLNANVAQLLHDDRPGDVDWPLSAVAWPKDLDQQTGWRLLQTLLDLLTRKSAEWWTRDGLTWSWIIYALDQLVQDDSTDPLLRSEAARYGKRLLAANPGDVNGVTRTVPHADVEARFARMSDDDAASVLDLDETIDGWVAEACAMQ